ncbi:MAG TPA: DUF962 domain-containing protein [Polyangiaceae bacterium]|nr:DUF962 domain-containing protein [Polyangiaceae bacterium]
MDRPTATFDEFWPEYVRAHSNKTNRTLHVVGMGLALACVLAAIVKRRPLLLLAAPIFGYGFAWAGHFFVEKNKPSTFSHPLHSLRANLLLFWKTVCGDMDAEVARIVDEATRADGAPDDGASVASAMN